jgi:hypothetical protein
LQESNHLLLPPAKRKHKRSCFQAFALTLGIVTTLVTGITTAPVIAGVPGAASAARSAL